MSRAPVAISLEKAGQTPKKTVPQKKPSAKAKPKTTRTKSARRPTVLPLPKTQNPEPDYFDDAPFIDNEEDLNPTNHLPDMSKGIRWGSIFFASLLTFISIAISLWATNLVQTLFALHPYFGWAGLGVAAVAAFTLVVLILKEFLSIAQLRKLEKIRENAEQVLLGNQPAEKTIAAVKQLYSNRADLNWQLNELKTYDTEIIDAPDHLQLYEKTLMAPLDQEAKSIIASAAKRVSVITALNPSAVLDILFVGFQVLQMLRKLIALYGGRPALFGALKLARMTATHLAVTGGLALSDTFLQQFLGKGLAGRLSTKLGEGTVNGIMTTRIGLSAIELCRPFPFSAVEKPNLKGFLGELIGSLKG